MKYLLALLSCAFLAFAAPAQAITVTADVTVDNVYGLYVGTPSTLSLLGANSDWVSVERYSFEAAAGDYVYVAAWDLGGIQGFQGIVSGESRVFRTNTIDWTYTLVAPSALPGWTPASGSQPGLASLKTALAGASWSAVTGSAPHSTWPWGGAVSDPATLWIWSDSLTDPTLSDGTLVVFRTVASVASVVPEPSMALLMLGGLLIVGTAARRRAQS